MKKRFLTLIIPAILLLNAAAPRLSANLILNELFSHHKILVYSFIWVPLLEASVLVTEHVIPAPSLSTTPNVSKEASGTSKGDNETQQDFVFNTGTQEPVTFKRTVLKPFTLPFITLIDTLPDARMLLSRETDLLLVGFLLAPVLILLTFKPLLPRSDVALAR